MTDSPTLDAFLSLLFLLALMVLAMVGIGIAHSRSRVVRIREDQEIAKRARAIADLERGTA